MGLSEAVVKQLQTWRRSPLVMVSEAIHAEPSIQQAQLLTSFPKHNRITIRSGHGTGKDAAASWIIANFLTTRPYSKVVCTAPTNRQLKDILWSEISKWLRKSELADEFVIQSDKIFHKSAPKEWWCRAVSASVKASPDEQAETLAGFHGDHLLFVVDEASGVPDPVFIPLEGAMTQEENYILLIGNMTRDKGYFYDSHFHPEISKAWKKLHWNSEESSNVKKSYINYMATKYGSDSNVYRVRVLGDPPDADETALIPLSKAIACIGNDVFVAEDEVDYLAVDVARFGNDKSIILPRKGLKIFPWDELSGQDTMYLSGRVQMAYQDRDARGVAIDEVGVGGGVVDYLQRRVSLPGVYGVNVAWASSDVKKYHRLRDELWCNVRDRVLSTSYSFPDDIVSGETESLGNQLANELASVRYGYDKNNAIVVESKKDMKARGVESPNIADALGLSEYFYSYAHVLWPAAQKRNKRKQPHPTMENYSGSNAGQNWMSV